MLLKGSLDQIIKQLDTMRKEQLINEVGNEENN